MTAAVETFGLTKTYGATRALGPGVSWIGPRRYGSLFYWSVGNDQISTGVSLGDLTVLIAVGLCALLAVTTAFGRLGLH
jgi:ABC-2 type transport system permease protein